jgi:dihydropyrimidinase
VEERRSRVTNQRWMADLTITNGRIINADGAFDADVVIKDEKIIAFTDKEHSIPTNKTIDASGKNLFPGLIDVHVHFYYDDIHTLAQSAAYGGLTTLIPFIRGSAEESILKNIRKYIEEGSRDSVVDFGYHAYLFENPRALEEIPEAARMGVNSFKMFLGYKKRGMMVSSEFMLKAFGIIQSIGGIGMVHAEDGELIDYLEEKSISDGLMRPSDFPKTCPNAAEGIAVYRAVELAHMSKCRLYIVHLSTGEGLKCIEDALMSNKDVVAETCPQYLLFSEKAMEQHGPYARIGPPLRQPENNHAMWRGLRQGVISVVSSDHSAHSKELKEPGWDNIFKAPFGMIGVETIAPLMFYEGVVRRRFPLTWFPKVMSENPAKIFGLFPKKGIIQVGSDADITIYDPEKEMVVKTNDLHSKAGYCLYDGWKIKGYPVMSMLRGKILLNEGKLEQAPGYGNFLYRPVS